MILEITDLRKAFGGLVAVRDLDLAVGEGDVVGLIGPNGSGKTTSFNLISGYLAPDEGRVRFNGSDITGLTPHKICQSGIARTFQLTTPFSGMTALQNVMVGKMYGGESSGSIGSAEEECRELLAFVGLSSKNDGVHNAPPLATIAVNCGFGVLQDDLL